MLKRISCDHIKAREATAMLSVSEIVAKTEAMFDLFNHHFYNGELTRPGITVSPDGGRGAYGWCSVYEIWQASGEAYREINICAEYIDRPIGEVAATMLHEMAHLYNLTHEIKDVSNNGYYHNKKFKETAETHGLHIEHHATYGWTITDAYRRNRRMAGPAAWHGGYNRQPQNGAPDQNQGRR